MLKRKILIFLLFTGALTANAQASKICTFNIRFENPNDGIHQWENRKESVINFIKVEDIDVVGMQEVLQSQIQYLETNLPHYQRIGVGRDDGHAKGEYSPIFYKKSKYQLLDSGTFWLSTDRT
ncbi:MAG: endonuclease, partial [Bacteroidota bacterium]